LLILINSHAYKSTKKTVYTLGFIGYSVSCIVTASSTGSICQSRLSCNFMYESNIPCDSWCLSTWRSWTWKYHHRMASDHTASHRHRCLPTTSHSPHWRHHIRLECPAVVSKLLDTDILAYQLAHCPASSSINNRVYVDRLLQPKI